MPTSSSTMNYNSVILVGVVALASLWWIVHGAKNYPGPRLTHLYVMDGIEADETRGGGIMEHESSVEPSKEDTAE